MGWSGRKHCNTKYFGAMDSSVMFTLVSRLLGGGGKWSCSFPIYLSSRLFLTVYKSRRDVGIHGESDSWEKAAFLSSELTFRITGVRVVVHGTFLFLENDWFQT